jgi:cytochrome c-type biogenesis protein CcmH/NrfG
VALARALSAAGAFPEAVTAYRDAARITPDDAESWRRLGEALLHLAADPQGAIDALREGLRIDPRSARGYGALAEALHALGEYPEAAASYAEAVRLDPDFLANRPAAQEIEAASRRGAAWPAPDQGSATGS